MASNTTVEAFAPATMGNVGVGFDILGLAFHEPGDTVTVERCETPGVIIKDIQGDGGALPREAKKNTASVAVQAFLEEIETEAGVAITLHKGLPLGSGLGSSAASAVAAVVAANKLFDEPLTREALLPACLEGEALVSGYHADNAGPALLGGITLITGTTVDTIHKLPVPEDLHFALMTPNVSVSTMEARSVLPNTVPLKTMVHQTGMVAGLIDALYRGDVEAMAAAMEGDAVIEPARVHLIPMLNEARQAARQAGACGLVISGAGPTLCAVCNSKGTAVCAADALQAVYDEAGIGGVSRVTAVNETGAYVTKVV